MTHEEMAELISTYNDYLGRLSNAIQHFCEDLTESGFQELSPSLPAIVDGLEWINEAAGSFIILKKVKQESYELFQTQVKNMEEALANKDYVLLHDLFEFEFLPLFEVMKVSTTPDC